MHTGRHIDRNDVLSDSSSHRFTTTRQACLCRQVIDSCPILCTCRARTETLEKIMKKQTRQERDTQVAWRHISTQITPYFHRYINKGQQSLILSSAVDLCISPVNIVCLRMVSLFLFQMNWPFSKGQPVTILTCITVSRTLLDTESQTGSNTGTTLGLFHFMPYPKRYSLFTGQFWIEFNMYWSMGHWLAFQDPVFYAHLGLSHQKRNDGNTQIWKRKK